jgi:hypothetical protein
MPRQKIKALSLHFLIIYKEGVIDPKCQCVVPSFGKIVSHIEDDKNWGTEDPTLIIERWGDISGYSNINGKLIWIRTTSDQWLFRVMTNYYKRGWIDILKT